MSERETLERVLMGWVFPCGVVFLGLILLGTIGFGDLMDPSVAPWLLAASVAITASWKLYWWLKEDAPND